LGSLKSLLRASKALRKPGRPQTLRASENFESLVSEEPGEPGAVRGSLVSLGWISSLRRNECAAGQQPAGRPQ